MIIRIIIVVARVVLVTIVSIVVTTVVIVVVTVVSIFVIVIKYVVVLIFSLNTIWMITKRICTTIGVVILLIGRTAGRIIFNDIEFIGIWWSIEKVVWIILRICWSLYLLIFWLIVLLLEKIGSIGVVCIVKYIYIFLRVRILSS